VKNLKKADLVALLSHNSKWKVAVNDREVIRDPETVPRLTEAGLIVTGGQVTEKGKEVVKQTRQKLKPLQEGVPFGARKSRDSNKALVSVHPWIQLSVGGKLITTNKEVMYLGKPMKGMVPVGRAEDDLKKKATQVVLSWCKTKDFVKIEPVLWYLKDLGELELIWMQDKKRDRLFAIQSQYYDFLFGRFPRSDWYANTVGDPVQIRSRKKGHGLKNGCVGFVMALLSVKSEEEIARKTLKRLKK